MNSHPINTVTDEEEDDGLCPDGDLHPADDCWKHMCSNYVSELEAIAPWGTSGRGLKGWAK